MRNQAGFTLIELMIVVVIIAILAAIAIPQYQNYIIRTQTTRAMAELNSLRTALEICENDGNADAVCLEDTINSDMLISAPTIARTPPTTSINATFGRKATARLNGGTITMVRSAAGVWECSMNIPGIEISLLPRGCR